MLPRDVLQYNVAFMEDHCHCCQCLNEDVVVPTGWTTASDTAEAVATTVGAALVVAIIPSIATCMLDVLLKSRQFLELSGTVFQCVHHGTETHRLLKVTTSWSLSCSLSWTLSWTLSWIPVTSFMLFSPSVNSIFKKASDEKQSQCGRKEDLTR